MDFFSFFLSGCYRPELWRLRCKMNVPVPPPYQGQPDSSRGGWSDPGSSNHMRCSSHGQGLLSLNFYIQGVFFLQLFLLIITANVKTSCSQLELLLQIKISIKKTPRLLSDFFFILALKIGRSSWNSQGLLFRNMSWSFTHYEAICNASLVIIVQI